MTDASIPLLLARHGQTEWSRSGRYQGRCDPPLIGEGRAQAVQIGMRARGRGVRSILSSPLRRARETAEIVAATLGLDAPRVDARLIELAYGAWEGLTQAEVRARWPDQLRQWKRVPDTAALPGGESLADLRQRLQQFLQDPEWTAHDGSVLIVSHAGPIRIALLEAAGMPLGMFRNIPVATGSLHALTLHRRHGNSSHSTQLEEQKPCALQ
jgi:probable phosphoglycerate mutase